MLKSLIINCCNNNRNSIKNNYNKDNNTNSSGRITDVSKLIRKNLLDKDIYSYVQIRHITMF